MSSVPPVALEKYDNATAYQAAALEPFDQALICELQNGLALVARPLLAVAERLGCSEQTVIERVKRLTEQGIFKRFGVVVRHHELGYRANGMVVWDVPDTQVERVGVKLAQRGEVRLCYRRPRCPPDWPYNLFCMIHGRDKQEVLAALERLCTELELHQLPHEILFSTHRFKQRGAQYPIGKPAESAHV
jgi:DNA-binding Lrp family transcriptional regulator